MGAALTYISCMDTAYVRENPAPKWPYKVQYLHFRSLKLLVTKGNLWCKTTGPETHAVCNWGLKEVLLVASPQLVGLGIYIFEVSSITTFWWPLVWKRWIFPLKRCGPGVYLEVTDLTPNQNLFDGKPMLLQRMNMGLHHQEHHLAWFSKPEVGIEYNSE